MPSFIHQPSPVAGPAHGVTHHCQFCRGSQTSYPDSRSPSTLIHRKAIHSVMKILISDNLSKLGVELLKRYEQFQVDVNVGMKSEELKKIIGNYQGLIVRSETKVTADILSAADNLKVIGRAGTGVDNIDVPVATKKGIVVMNAAAGNSVTTAEHTISLMMSLARKIPQAHAKLK